MDDSEGEDRGTDYLKYLDPDQQADYERSPAGGEGLVEKVREAVGEFLRREEDGSVTGEASTESSAAQGDVAPGTAEAVTSNYSEDVGRAPTGSDVEDVN